MVKTVPQFNSVMPTADYVAKISEITSVEGKFGPQLRWRFDVTDPAEFAGQTVTGWCSDVITQKSKAYLWIRAAQGGQDIDWNQPFDFDDLIGRSVSLSLTISVSKESGNEFNKIESVRPYRPARRATAPKPQDVPLDAFAPDEQAQAAAAGAKPGNGNGAHWSESAQNRALFFATAGNDLGLSTGEIHARLGVESIKDYTGTMDEALKALMASVLQNQATA
jgi:hypothetical protein